MDLDPPGEASSRALPPRSAYIHIPFCRHRCGYCNFSVVAGRDELVDRFLRAIEIELSGFTSVPLDTLFVGGGTPTHLSVDQFERLMGTLHRAFHFNTDAEMTVEANPEDIDDEKLRILADQGINRISLGVQSFQAAKLKTLERSHDGPIAITAIEAAAETIGNVSIDLIFAVPGETVDDWRTDLRTAVELPIDHLSAYTLTFEKGTAFWNRRRRGDLTAPPEDDDVAMYEAAREAAPSAGMEHYEVSNFARPGRRCRHNQAYWRGDGWYAAGPGAARFVGGRRETNHRSPTTYLRRVLAGGDPTAERETPSAVELVRERLAFGVRMIAGVDLDRAAAGTDVDVDAVCSGAIDWAVSAGLVESFGRRIRLTSRGVLFADSVASRLLG